MAENLVLVVFNAICVPFAHIALLFRPHIGRIGFVVPHDVTQKGVHEEIGLVHVADHAGAGRNSPAEFVLQRMTGFTLGNGRIDRALVPS